MLWNFFLNTLGDDNHRVHYQSNSFFFCGKIDLIWIEYKPNTHIYQLGKVLIHLWLISEEIEFFYFEKKNGRNASGIHFCFQISIDEWIKSENEINANES